MDANVLSFFDRPKSTSSATKMCHISPNSDARRPDLACDWQQKKFTSLIIQCGSLIFIYADLNGPAERGPRKLESPKLTRPWKQKGLAGAQQQRFRLMRAALGFFFFLEARFCAKFLFDQPPFCWVSFDFGGCHLESSDSGRSPGQKKKGLSKTPL
jgi:hypothetical protein